MIHLRLLSVLVNPTNGVFMLHLIRPIVVIAAILVSACSEATPPRKAMVATANTHATKAAADILLQGGSATDAAITAQLVLTLTEPQSSGIGGGLFMLHYNGTNQDITSFDGREKAPLAADERLFLKADGSPMPWLDAAYGGRPVGTPGVIAALWKAHQKFGKLPWATLFKPAIDLAETGFPVSERLQMAIEEADLLEADTDASEIYFIPDNGTASKTGALPVGHTLKNPAYARTLKLIAEKGLDGFYKGEIAEAIVTAVQSHAENPGLLSLEDLASYEAIERQPVCQSYRNFNVCGMGPPTSGGLTTLMILGMLEPYNISALHPDGVMAAHMFSQASRLAFADRDKYMGDADFIDVPVAGLLDKKYLRSRARLINPLADMGKIGAGTPAQAAVPKTASSADIIENGTSHLAIVDLDGNAVSMTMSVERSFGARITAAGFVLNNQLTDFSFIPSYGGNPVANKVEAGKRPRSSMSPTLILNNDGSLFAAVGSPGGSRIIGYTTQALIGLMDWNMSMQTAISQRHIINRNDRTEIEDVSVGSDLFNTLVSFGKLAAPLADMGHDVQVKELNSGLHGIRVLENGNHEGGADPRREGTVVDVISDQ